MSITLPRTIFSLPGSRPEDIRRALNTSPVFSHRRNSAVPVAQNVNVVLPATDPDAWVPMEIQPPRAAMVEVRPPVVGRVSQSQSIPAGRPPQMVRRKNKKRTLKLLASGLTDVNDRFLDKNADVMSNAVPTGNPMECSFEIPSFLMPSPNPSHISSNQRCPSFLLPGPSINPSLVTLLVEHWTGVSQGNNPELNRVKNQISQIEFEQKCLVPALRAHVLGGSVCRSRELTVYLEWLLYLRQKLFNI